MCNFHPVSSASSHIRSSLTTSACLDAGGQPDSATITNERISSGVGHGEVADSSTEGYSTAYPHSALGCSPPAPETLACVPRGGLD